MGISILWVMLYHADIKIYHAILLPLGLLRETGYGGVDIFFFLSGFGLIFAWDKNKNAISFYRRRLKRILPPYVLVTTIYFLAGVFFFGCVWEALLNDFAFINFILSRWSTYWFIPSIILCYFVFPLIITTTTNKRASLEIFLFFILFIMCITISTILHKKYYLQFLLRLPSFTIGMCTAYRLSTNKEAPFHFLIIIAAALASVALVYIVYFSDHNTNWNYGLWYYPFIVLSFPIAAGLSHALAHAESFHICRRTLSFLKLCGDHSLELYLVHIPVYYLGKLNLFYPPDSLILNIINYGRFVEYLSYSAISLVFAITIKRILALVTPKPNRLSGPLHIHEQIIRDQHHNINHME